MKSVSLYQFDNFDMDTYINMYLSKDSARGTKSRTVIECKVIYLQDLIIRKSMSNKDTDDFRLHSQILKNIIGDEYSAMLSTLIDMKYIKESVNCNYKYIKGKQSKCFSIVEDKCQHIVSTTTYNKKIINYLAEEEEQLFQFRNKYIIPEIDRRYGKDFRVTYEKSLCKIKIEKPDEFEQYIPIAVQLHKEKKKKRRKKKRKRKSKPMIEHYYNYVKNELSLKYKHIHSIDTAGRIYHALTNTNRDFKQFLNIDISADCKNSHPVLFCYFIMKWRGINIEDSYKITSIMHGVSNIKDIREYCYTVVDKSLIDRLSNDELEYIYLTTNGLLWDTVVKKHPKTDRNEVKEKMFAEVFYSNEKEIRCWQEYAKEFQEQFPKVFELIKYWKNSKAPDIHKYLNDNGISTLKKATSALSIAMMNLEAKIFIEILKRIYRKRWYAVHIHDCIIIPKTKSKNQPKKEQVIKIMQDVYKEYGLAPSFD